MNNNTRQKRPGVFIILLTLIFLFPLGLYLLYRRMTSDPSDLTAPGRALRCIGLIFLALAAICTIISANLEVAELGTVDSYSIVTMFFILAVPATLFLILSDRSIKRAVRYASASSDSSVTPTMPTSSTGSAGLTGSAGSVGSAAQANPAAFKLRGQQPRTSSQTKTTRTLDGETRETTETRETRSESGATISTTTTRITNSSTLDTNGASLLGEDLFDNLFQNSPFGSMAQRTAEPVTKVVSCPGCGASNTVTTGVPCQCEYCGNTLES